MKKKKIISTILIGLFFLCAFLVCVLKPDDDFSVSERRPLKDFPNITGSQISSGRFMSEFEEYVLDQFPFRDGFRTIKAW